MNIPISDIDISTTLLPEKVREIFEAAGCNVHDTGLEHGTITVVVNGEPFEITTCRRDVETDGRKAVIAFSEDWAEDAQRRDFRCNSLYMDMDGHIYDYAVEEGGGIEDCKTRSLVFVGDAETRIREDYLRILRFFRFQATLGATGDDVGLQACKKFHEGMEKLSGERIEAEMMKLMKSADPVPAIRAMIDAEVFGEVIDRTSCDLDVLRRVCIATNDPVVRLASLFDWDVVAAERTMDKWKSSKSLSHRVEAAVNGCSICMNREDLKEEMYRIGAERAVDLMILTWAEEADPDMSVTDLHELIAEIQADIPVFPIKGGDLIALGVKPGPIIGRILKEVEEWWISNGYPEVDACREHLARVM